jgi:uncharacterized protein YqkB
MLDALNKSHTVVDKLSYNKHTRVFTNAQMTAKDWPAMHCIPLKETKQMLPRRMSVWICEVEKLKGNHYDTEIADRTKQ